MTAYSYFQNIILAIVALGAWLGIGAALNLAGIKFNSLFISMGASVQSAETLSNASWIFGSFPFVFIIGWYLNGIVRASEVRNTGTSYGNQSFGMGTILLLTCLVVSILFAFVGGMMVDTLEHKISSAVTIPVVWQTVQGTTYPMYMNMLYFTVYFIQGLGIFLFFQSIFPQSTGSTYSYGGY